MPEKDANDAPRIEPNSGASPQPGGSVGAVPQDQQATAETKSSEEKPETTRRRAQQAPSSS